MTIEDITKFVSHTHGLVEGEKVFAGGIEWYMGAKVVYSYGNTYLGCYLYGTGGVGWRRFVNAHFYAQGADGIELRSRNSGEPVLFHDEGQSARGWPRFVEKQVMLYYCSSLFSRSCVGRTFKI